MRIYNGEENFESFYLKHFTSFTDLQNCTECLKNLSVYSGSIYYQTEEFVTGSFQRILTENDSWLDRTFWKNGGNSFTSSFSIGTLNSNSLNFITSGSTRAFISSSGYFGINTIIPSERLDVSGNINYTGLLKISGSSGSNGQFLKTFSSSNSWANIGTGDVTGLNAFTSSVESSSVNLYAFTSSIKSYTGSINVWTGSIEAYTGSVYAFTSSINSWSGSINTFTSSINSLTGSYFKQGGNSFGQSGSLGTSDTNNLHIITSGSTRLFVSSSGVIGIGTSTPLSTYILTTNGTTLTTNGKFGTDALGVNIFNYFGTSPRISSTTSLDMFSGGTPSFTWTRSGDIGLMKLTDGGLRVGDNNTAVYKLDVAGTSGFTGLISLGKPSDGIPMGSGSIGQFMRRSQVVNGYSTLSDVNNWANIGTGDVTGLNAFTSSLVTTYFKQGGNSFGGAATLGSLEDVTLNFITSGSTKMSINNVGNILIGTTTDIGFKLNVSGNMWTTGFTRLSTGTGLVYIGSNSISSQTVSLKVGFDRASSGFANIDLIGDSIYGEFGLRLSRGNTGANSTSTIEHQGTGSLILKTVDGGGIRLLTNSAERVTIQPSGNVGIGTTNPTSKLHVFDNINTVGNPTIRLQGASGGYGAGIEAGSALAGGSYLAMGKAVWDGEAAWNTTVSTQNSYFSLHTTSNGVVGEKMRISSGGNVGIGTTNPLAKLDVTASTDLDGIAVTNSVQSPVIFLKSNNVSAAIRNWAILTNHYNLGDYSLMQSNAIGGNAVTAGTNRFYISSTGNVGLGTTSPNKKLEISNAGEASLRLNNTLANFWDISNTAPSGTLDFIRGGITHISVGNTGNVGFGTINPLTKFHVKRTGINGAGLASTGIFATDAKTIGDGIGLDFFAHDAADNEQGYGSIRYTIASPTNGAESSELSITTFQAGTNTERIKIGSTGNVGIGTTNPLAKLDVTASTDLDGIAVTNSVQSPVIFLKSNNVSAAIRNWAILTNHYNLGDYSLMQSNAIGGNAVTAGTNRFYISSTGNVGLGTTAPSTKLHVSNVTDSEIRNTESGSGNHISLYQQAGDSYILAGKSSGTPTQNLNIYTGGAERMRISSTGNVGIGTTSPTQKLHVVGYGMFSSGLLGVGGLSMYGDNLSTTGAILTTSGNFGIGSTNPTKKLHVFDNINTVGNPTIRLQGAAGGYGAGIEAGSELTLGSYLAMGKAVWDGEAAWNTTVSTQNSYFSLHTTSNGVVGEKMRISSGGNMGIGTTAPSEKLHVYSASAFNRVIVENTGDFYNGLQLKRTGGTVPTTWDIYTPSNATSLNLNNGADRLTILSNGNVGIGTTSPLAKLEIGGSYAQTGAFVSARNAGNSFEFGHNNQAGYGSTIGANAGTGSPFLAFNAEVGSSTVNTFRTRGLVGRIITNDVGSTKLMFQRVTTATADNQTPVTDMVIDGTGNVGIGTVSPTAKFNVNGGSSLFETPSSGQTWFPYTDGSNYIRGIYTLFANPSNVEFMRIASTGNVGIGTASPTSKLQVVGLSTYADNAAALAGGLSTGAFYRTSTGVLMVAY